MVWMGTSIISIPRLAQAVYAILNGEDYEKEITVPVALVTRDNVNSYDMDGWQ